MTRQTHAKQERIVEAVRRGLEGEEAAAFVRHSGLAITATGVVRHIKAMGGQGKVRKLIESGKSNVEVVQECFPGSDLAHMRALPPEQPELFDSSPATPNTVPFQPSPDAMYETRKISFRAPEALYEAIRMAARAEKMSQNDLIVELLTRALSRMPGPVEEDGSGGSSKKDRS